MNWKRIDGVFERRIRYIVAEPGFVIGDCYFGIGPNYIVDPLRNLALDVSKECWRYSTNDVPLARQPTHFMDLPEPPVLDKV